MTATTVAIPAWGTALLFVALVAVGALVTLGWCVLCIRILNPLVERGFERMRARAEQRLRDKWDRETAKIDAEIEADLEMRHGR